MQKFDKALPVLTGVTVVAILAALWAVFIYAPTEKTMGEVQRIFYFHVASAWNAFLAFFVVFSASIFFLSRQIKIWDDIARTSAEIGILFTSLVLITGPIWAKPIWNTWWTWDARLSTTLILWLIYSAYLMLRAFVTDKERGARFAAVFGIIGFVDVPIVYMSIRWWRTLHPAPVILGGADSGLAAEMLTALLISLLAFTLVYTVLLMLRLQLHFAEAEIEQIKEKLVQ